MKPLLYFILLLFISISTATSAETISIDNEDILYIYDADTFFIACESCMNKKRGVRVLGVDAPEIKGKCKWEKHVARQAKRFTVGKLRAAQNIELVVNTKRRYDRYNRLLASVLINGIDLGQMLLDAGLARPYSGGKRKGWCY